MNDQSPSLPAILAEFDAQVAINVRSDGAPWPAHALTTALERQGLVPHIEGHWIMPNGDDSALFTVTTAPTRPHPSSHLMLVMDVPCVSPDRSAFATMVACARDLGMQLGGTLVDDGNQPLPDTSLSQIADQVAAFHEHMEKSGLAPGSVLARRLFARDGAGK